MQRPMAGTSASVASADLIARCEPGLCVVLGPTDRLGTQRLGRTLVVNPRCLIEGRAAWLDWSRLEHPEVRPLDLSDPGIRRPVPSFVGRGPAVVSP